MTKTEDLGRDRLYDLVAQFGYQTMHVGGKNSTRELLEMCQLESTSRVLDVGCGTGYTAYEIAKTYGSRVTGVDLANNMVKVAQKRARKGKLEHRVDFRVASAYELPFNDDTFDVVILEAVFVALDDKTAALEEIVRVLRLGGTLALNVGIISSDAPSELAEQVKGPVGLLAGPIPYNRLIELIEDFNFQIVKTAEKPMSNLITTSIKEIGLPKYIIVVLPKFLIKFLTDSNLRKVLKRNLQVSKEVRDIIFKREDTKQYFNHVLLVAQKS